MLASLPPTSDGLVQELRKEHSRGARKGCTPRRLLFLAYISPMTMRKEEPDIYCWGRKELSPLRPASLYFGHEGKGEQILIPKNGWASAKWSAGIIRPTMVFCG